MTASVQILRVMRNLILKMYCLKKEKIIKTGGLPVIVGKRKVGKSQAENQKKTNQIMFRIKTNQLKFLGKEKEGDRLEVVIKIY